MKSWTERAEALGYDRFRLAELIGRDQSTVWEWLNGRSSGNSQRQLFVLIMALEQMTAKERAAWELAVELEPMPAPVQRKRKAEKSGT